MDSTTVDIFADETAIVKAETAAGRAGEILLQAHGITVTADTYEEAGVFLRGVKALGKEIEAERKSFTDPLNVIVKRITDRYRPGVDACAKAEGVVKGKLSAYADEQERQRQEAERIARAAQAKEEERLRKLAAAAEARGDGAKAEQFAARAEVVSLAPVSVDAPAPEAEGISYRTTWSAEVTDLRALCAAVLAGTVPESAIVPDMKFLGATARATKGVLSWPGVRWVSKRDVAARVSS